MREIDSEILAGIGALEAAAAHQHAIETIRDWPGLSAGQRMVALAIACLEYIESRPPSSIEIGRFAGLPSDRVEKIFDGLEHAPYYWSELPGTRSWAFLPSQALEYGEA